MHRHLHHHDLPHITSTDDGVIQMFEANGSGLAVGDLDNDRDLDIVLGSTLGPNSILWNEGDLQFQEAAFGDGNTRAITLVDVDGDMSLDIVLTRTTGAINYWHNQGEGDFVQEVLPGISRPASVLNWADMDGDGDLDLVTASYDAGLLDGSGQHLLVGRCWRHYLLRKQRRPFRATGIGRRAPRQWRFCSTT